LLKTIYRPCWPVARYAISLLATTKSDGHLNSYRGHWLSCGTIMLGWGEIMKEQCRVALYGNSLFMAGVESSLRGRPELDVVRVNDSLPGAAQRLCAVCPDVVIFDLTAHEAFAFSFLREHPGLPVIGLDLNNNALLVLHSQQRAARTVNELLQVIQSYPH
jgi:hypothetical protein